MFTRRGLLKTLGGGVAALLACGGYAVAEPLVRLNVARYRLTPSGWPSGLRLRIAALADFHACQPWMPAERIAGICEQTNVLQPDVILLLGDYVSGMRLSLGKVAPEVWAESLATLKAPLGVHAVLGNHDWWEDPHVQARGGGVPASQVALEAAGIPVYSNRASRFEKDGRPFWLAGLEDQLAFPSHRGFPPVRKDDLPGTLAQVTDDAPVILMAHEPDIFPDVPARVSLTLSGHTHGGQVRLFGYAPVVPSRYGARYVHGHVRENDRDIVISGGLGCSGLPIRFGAPPEIVLIELGEG